MGKFQKDLKNFKNIVLFSGIQCLLRNRNGLESRLFDEDYQSDAHWRYETMEDQNHNGINVTLIVS